MLFLDWMLTLVFSLQLGFQQIQESRRILPNALDALYSVPQICDFCGDRRTLFLVLCKYGWIGLMPDLIANFAAFDFQSGDLRFRLIDFFVQIVWRVQPVFF